MENPVKVTAGIIGSLSVIIGGFLAVDSRYVHADDLKNFKIEYSQAIQQQSYENRTAITELRKQSLEDKVFEIQLIPVTKRTTLDNARLDKYTRDLSELNNTAKIRAGINQRNQSK